MKIIDSAYLLFFNVRNSKYKSYIILKNMEDANYEKQLRRDEQIQKDESKYV